MSIRIEIKYHFDENEAVKKPKTLIKARTTSFNIYQKSNEGKFKDPNNPLSGLLSKQGRLDRWLGMSQEEKAYYNEVAEELNLKKRAQNEPY